MTIEELCDAEAFRGTLVAVEVGASPGDVIYYHEWAKDDGSGHLICVMLAGFGRWYLHDLKAKELRVQATPPIGLHLVDDLND